jgi:DNA polymerase-3 subunit beta
MRFDVAHAALLPATATAGRFVPTRTTLPVLTGILIDARDDRLTLRATDLDVGLEIRVPASVPEPGAIVLPAHYLTEIVRRIPGGAVSFETAEDRSVARLRWGRSDFQIHGFDAEQFPDFPALPAAEATPFPQRQLRETLRQTLFAASADTTRAVLTGAEIVMADGHFRALATDGLRVAYYRTDPDRQDWSSGQTCLVPAKALQEVVRCLSEDDEALGHMVLHTGQLLMDLGEIRILVRLLEGRYPALLDLVPKAYPTEVSVDRQLFQDVCDRVGLISDSPDRLYAVTLSIGADSVVVSSRSPDVGEAREELPAEVNGPAVDVTLNARLLTEASRHLDGQNLIIDVSGPGTALRLRRPGDGRCQYLQMPIRIG